MLKANKRHLSGYLGEGGQGIVFLVPHYNKEKAETENFVFKVVILPRINNFTT